MGNARKQPRATAVRYDAPTRRVVMELGSGYQVGVPLARLREIAKAQPRDLEDVELLGGGSILHWEALDADYSVSALVLELVGPALVVREAARAAGKVRTPRKAAAARKNGRRGGRPRNPVKK